MKFGNKATPCG